MQRVAGSLFRSALVTISDVSCTTQGGACALDESGERHRLVFTRSGAAITQRLDARRPDLTLDPVQAVLFDAGATYRVRHPSREPHRCTTFAFTPSVFADDAARSPRLVSAEVLLRYHRLRRALLRQSRWDDASPLAVEEESVALLRGATMRLASLRGARRRRHQELAESAKMVLASAPGSPHRLGDVARSFGVSASHLAHVFRAEVGLPMHQYLLNVRMAVALDRLSAGATDLSRLALDLGFATHSHFSAAFRRFFGTAPRVARAVLEHSNAHQRIASGARTAAPSR